METKMMDVMDVMQAVKAICYGRSPQVTGYQKSTLRKALRKFFPLEAVKKMEEEFYRSL